MRIDRTRRPKHGPTPPGGARALRVAALLAVSLCGACASSAARATHFAHVPEACPAPGVEAPAACGVGVPDGYGLTPEQPLAWGPQARDGLWQGRLVCDGGAEPRVAHLGATDEGLARWTVMCPRWTQPQLWYVDTSRCASPCPPAGVSVLSPQVYADLMRSQSALESKAIDEALTAAREAAASSPTRSERVVAWLGVVHANAGHTQEAIDHLEAAYLINPTTPQYAIFAAMVELNAGRYDAAQRRVTELIWSLPPDHRDVAEAKCVKAAALINLDRPDEAELLRYEACASGFEACCE